MSVITDLIDENSSCNARIAELEARIVELESAAESLRISRDYHHEQENEYRRRWAGVTTGAHSIVIPERDAVIRKAVGMCNRIPGSTTWNAAEYAYDELVAILYAAPVSEAKAQGVVIPPSPYMPGSQPTDFTDYELGEIHGRIAMWEEVKRLNATPVQQVSVPDVLREAIKWADHLCFECGALVQTRAPSVHVYNKTFEAVQAAKAMLAAAPAATAADAWIPVGDRLPEVESRLDQECRAGTLSIAPLNVSAAVLVFDGEKVRSTRLEWFDGCLPLPYCITHWMPLPAAPAAHSSKGVV